MNAIPPSEHPSPEDGFAARFRQLLASYGSPAGLAKAIGRSEGALRKWMRGESEPNVTDLRSICEHTRANVEWLVTGRGEMRLGSATEVREDGAAYDHSGTSLDYGFLNQLMDVADEALTAHGVHIAPVKRSSMVVTLYQMFAATRDIDREAVSRLVRLAA